MMNMCMATVIVCHIWQLFSDDLVQMCKRVDRNVLLLRRTKSDVAHLPLCGHETDQNSSNRFIILSSYQGDPPIAHANVLLDNSLTMSTRHPPSSGRPEVGRISGPQSVRRFSGKNSSITCVLHATMVVCLVCFVSGRVFFDYYITLFNLGTDFPRRNPHVCGLQSRYLISIR